MPRPFGPGRAASIRSARRSTASSPDWSRSPPAVMSWTPSHAVLIGAVGALVMVYATLLLARLRIDDPIGAIPVHLAAGIWGTLAVALFGAPERIGTGLSTTAQLAVQSLGVLTAGAWSFGIAYTLLWMLDRMHPLRVSADDEQIGLNVAEHGARTDLVDLMHRAGATGALGGPVAAGAGRAVHRSRPDRGQAQPADARARTGGDQQPGDRAQPARRYRDFLRQRHPDQPESRRREDPRGLRGAGDRHPVRLVLQRHESATRCRRSGTRSRR
jgi:hypothetical protein